MRIAALVKQIPAFDELELGPDGKLVREGLDLEMNPYCRRAVAQAVALAHEHGGSCTFVTLGPPCADDVLREALAWADEEGVEADAVLVTDRAFAGSDTLATSRALAATLERHGRFDLVLVGRNSVDSDTGQVGPQLAAMLDLPFLTGVRELEVRGEVVHARCEHDDGSVTATMELPGVLSAAERLIEPCKMPPEARAAVDPARITSVTSGDLGPGPWGQDGSPTRVGAVRVHDVSRAAIVLDGPLEDQARRAVELLTARGALDGTRDHLVAPSIPAMRPAEGPAVAVVAEPDRFEETARLLGAAAGLAVAIDGHVVVVAYDESEADELAAYGADLVVRVRGAAVEEDAAAALTAWARERGPWAVLASSTAWGREVLARAAAQLEAGLTGDAIALDVEDGRLVAWKPAFGGQLVAAIHASSVIQMATVRAGVVPVPAPRATDAVPVEVRSVLARGRVAVSLRTREDDLDALADAPVVIGVGVGVDPSEYGELKPLLELLDAELGATRKVTDKGWLPRARQIGITGRTISPRCFVAIGSSGKFNHIVGVRSAGTILAVNSDPQAPVFEVADIGIVGRWQDVVTHLVQELERARPVS